MPLTPYDVLAPYQKLERIRRMDRWAQLQCAPPAQRCVDVPPPQEVTPAPVPEQPAPPPEPEAQAFEPPEAPPEPYTPSAPAMSPRPARIQRRFYNEILQKHENAAFAASRSVPMPAKPPV